MGSDRLAMNLEYLNVTHFSKVYLCYGIEREPSEIDLCIVKGV